MATYGYSSGYQGGGPSSVPAGYIEAYAQAGRNIGQGAQAIGNAIGESLQRYGQNKQENEFLQTRLETLAPYLNTVAQSGNIMDKNTPESKLLGDIEKFSSMSLAQKKATLLNAEFYLDRADKAKAREMQDIQSAAAQQQLAMGALQLGTAQREAAAAPFFTQALGEVMSMQPGRAPAVPYQDVTQEMLGKYGDKLTPTQMQALIPMMRRMGQAVPAGLVPVGAKMGPSGLETEYGAPPTIGSTAIPGTRMVQPTVGGKPFGASQKADIQGTNAYLNLEEPQQKAADKFITDFGNEKTIQNLSIAGSFLNQMNSFGASIGTPQYKPSDDIALIFSFMKTLDPGSTVREGEYATAKNAGSVPESVVNTYNQILSGKFLNDDQRKNFIETARKSYSGIAKEAETVASRYRSMAKDRGIPENLVVPSNMFEQVKQFEAKSQAQNLERFQSPEDMRARGIKRGLVFNPATGKYQEFQD
jgi:hypothetical protein